MLTSSLKSSHYLMLFTTRRKPLENKITFSRKKLKERKRKLNQSGKKSKKQRNKDKTLKFNSINSRLTLVRSRKTYNFSIPKRTKLGRNTIKTNLSMRSKLIQSDILTGWPRKRRD